jgi:hypothetical protein
LSGLLPKREETSVAVACWSRAARDALYLTCKVGVGRLIDQSFAKGRTQKSVVSSACAARRWHARFRSRNPGYLLR